MAPALHAEIMLVRFQLSLPFMAIATDELRTFIADELNKIEDLIDSRLIQAIKKDPTENPILISATSIPAKIVRLLFPRYQNLGWINVTYTGSSYAFKYDEQLLASVTREEASSYAQPTLKKELKEEISRAVKV